MTTRERVPVVRAEAEDVDRLVAPIALAFARDPFVRWYLPEPAQFLAVFPKVLRLHAEAVLRDGGAYRTEDFRGAALWYLPGSTANSAAIREIFSRSVGARTLEVLSAALAEMARFEPSEPHFYLRSIGVDPSRQGLGYGSALVTAGLEECDRRGLPAYLEATSAESRVLYERHSFEVTGEVRVEDAPPVWPMLRPARRDR
jgi:GNAT superfamily N-acetyltransferase